MDQEPHHGVVFDYENHDGMARTGGRRGAAHDALKDRLESSPAFTAEPAAGPLPHWGDGDRVAASFAAGLLSEMVGIPRSPSCMV